MSLPPQPLGPAPVRTVLVPVLLACVPFLIVQIGGGTFPQTGGAIAASSAFSAVALALMLVAFSRREDLLPVGAVVGFVWLIVDGVHPTTSSSALLLIGVGFLWAVALRAPGGAGREALPNADAIVVLSAGSALFATIMWMARIAKATAAYPLDVAGLLPMGAAAVIITVLLRRPELGDRIGPIAVRLLAFLVFLATFVAAVAGGHPPILLSGARALVVGLLIGALATVVVLERPGRAGLAGLGVLAVSAALVDRHSWVLVIAIVTFASLGFGLVRLPSSWPRRPLAPGPVFLWYVGAVCAGYALLDLFPSALRMQLFWIRLDSLVFALAVVAGGVVLMVLPGVGALARPLALAPLGRLAVTVTSGPWERALQVLDAVDGRFHHRVGVEPATADESSTTGQPGSADATPDATPDELAVPTRSAGERTLDLLLPASLWAAMGYVVTVLASSFSVAQGTWPTRWLVPSFTGFLTDPTGRLGWGTGDYWAIADHGYRLEEHREAFLPFLPIVLRFLHQQFGMTIPAAQVLVADISGLACVLLFWVWMGRRGMSFPAKTLAVVLFLVFPWNFLLFGYGYADATVVALILAAMLIIERGPAVIAGLVAAAAATTRPNGVPIIIFMLLHELVRSEALVLVPQRDGLGVPWSHGRWMALRLRRLGRVRWSAVVLPIAGLVALSIYMWRHSGEPLLWLTQESYYGHEPVTTLAAWLESMFQPWPTFAISNGWESINQFLTALVTLGALLAIPVIHRRHGAVYAANAIVIWLIAWSGSRVFTPGARLLMPITPFLAALAAPWLLRRRVLTAVVISLSLVGSFGLVILFTRGGELWVGW